MLCPSPKYSVDLRDRDTTGRLGVQSHLQHVVVGSVRDLRRVRLIFSLLAVKMGKKGRTELKHLGKTSRHLPAGRLDSGPNVEHL